MEACLILGRVVALLGLNGARSMLCAKRKALKGLCMSLEGVISLCNQALGDRTPGAAELV